MEVWEMKQSHYTIFLDDLKKHKSA